MYAPFLILLSFLLFPPPPHPPHPPHPLLLPLPSPPPPLPFFSCLSQLVFLLLLSGVLYHVLPTSSPSPLPHPQTLPADIPPSLPILLSLLSNFFMYSSFFFETFLNLSLRFFLHFQLLLHHFLSIVFLIYTNQKFISLRCSCLTLFHSILNFIFQKPSIYHSFLFSTRNFFNPYLLSPFYRPR
jgi:hypothetical protein